MMKRNVLLRELRRLCEAEDKVFTPENAGTVIERLVTENDSGREGTLVRRFLKIGRKRQICLVNNWPAFEDGVRLTPKEAEGVAGELKNLGHELKRPRATAPRGLDTERDYEIRYGDPRHPPRGTERDPTED